MSQAPVKTPAEQLATPVQFLKGVGPQRAELLQKLGIWTARDVLYFFPRDYQDMSELRPIDQLREDEPVSVIGVIDEVDLRDTSPGRSILGALIRQGNHFLRAIWFNQPYMRDKLPRGRKVLVSGSPKLSGFRWEMTHPKIELLGDDESLPGGRVHPVYSLTEGINQVQMRRIVRGVVETHAALVDEVFPEPFLAEHRLWTIREALPQVHVPRDTACLEQARRRFIYQELLVLQLALAIRRFRLTRNRRAPPLPITPLIDARITRLFPFELTAGQRQSIQEICADLGRDFPMNRLLQGDVGSGKTVVAIYAMLLTVANGQQAVLMAPTEVLAQQHARTLDERLRESKVRIGLLTGSLPASERNRTLAALAAGEIDLLVGTQAVIQSDVKFAKLGLVIIDEQHKFGVKQRATLKQAGLDPHYLVMTATPIPRTMTMTLFGDLDVSTLRQAPPGRQAVHTYLVGERRERWWEFFRKQLLEGRQGFVITPLVDESEKVAAGSLQESYEALANGELEAFRLGQVHGRMTSAEKEAAMSAFRRGETQVLVATSVVEVGVDVANATIMTIEGAQRFGLAQLHQLRGRVSRGTHPGYVGVFAEPNNEDARQRLDAFTRSTDGFELAEIDFNLRGPGDLLGTKQHGLPPLRIADLTRDSAVLEEARRDAQSLIANDHELLDPAYARLRQMVLVRYGQALELGDVG